MEISNEVKEKINSEWTVPRILKFLHEAKMGHEQFWFANLKEKVREIFQEDSTGERVIKYIHIMQCMALAVPRVFHLTKITLIFNLKVLDDIGIKNLRQIKEFDADTMQLFRRIVNTALLASFRVVLVNKGKLFGNEPWELVPYPYSQVKSEIIDGGAWVEFMEFMKEFPEVIHPPKETCIIS